MKRIVLSLCISLCFGAVAAGKSSTTTAVSDVPEYTYETVAAYAESWDFAIRWKTGIIKVVDETGILKREPQILELLNMNLGATKMVLVDGSNGDITIKLVDDLPAPYGQNGCGLSQSQLAVDGAQVVSNIIRIKTENRCMGKNEGAALLLHELGHALGFAKHAKEDDVMSQHDPAFELNKVNLTTLQRFLKGLYSLDVGAKIPGKKRMPEPNPDSFAYRIDTKAMEPVIASKSNPIARLPETTFATPTQKYQRIETRDAQGRLSWEFIQIDGGSGNISDITKTSATANKKSSRKGGARFETIQSSTSTIGPFNTLAHSKTPETTFVPSGTAKISPSPADDASRGYILFGPSR